MTIKEIYGLTQKAFETNHVKNLLLGEIGWEIKPNQKSAAATPQDWDRIMVYGIAPYCIEKDTTVRVSCFENAFRELLSGTPVEIAIAYEYYFCYCYSVKSHTKNFMFSQSLREALANSIVKNKDKLTQLTEWCGYAYPDGLYLNIQCMDSVVGKKFGMNIL
jgi:hypothetical protein